MEGSATIRSVNKLKRKKKQPVACRIIYGATKDAIETGDTESIFLDQDKVKKLAGITCERVKRENFTELSLDDTDILFLTHDFLVKEYRGYCRETGILYHTKLEDSMCEQYIWFGIHLAPWDVRERIARYMQYGLIRCEARNGFYNYKATDKLLRLANHKAAEWTGVIERVRQERDGRR